VRLVRWPSGRLGRGGRCRSSSFASCTANHCAQRDQEEKPGEFRDRQVWIGAADHERDVTLATFVPPPPLEIEPCLRDLDDYLAERGPDEGLLRVALAHYQLETIHPFLDGNGRIGRLLLALQMVWEGLLDRTCLFVSPALERQRPRYYDGLLRVSTEGDFLGWISFFVDVVAESRRRPSIGCIACRPCARTSPRACATCRPIAAMANCRALGAACNQAFGCGHGRDGSRRRTRESAGSAGGSASAFPRRRCGSGFSRPARAGAR
jgi:hypothetical protein